MVSKRPFILSFLVCFMLLMIIYLFSVRSYISDQNLTPFDVNLEDNNCKISFGQPASIGALPSLIRHWRLCRDSYSIDSLQAFLRIYKVNQRSNSQNVPSQFVSKVKGWLGNNETLYEKIFHQTVTSVFNTYTHENTVYNPLRGMRPGANDGDDVDAYLKDLIDTAAQSCDFCHPKEKTSFDVFKDGRIESKFSITAANVFKYDAFHGLVIAKQHNPINIDEMTFVDMMETTMKWFKIVHAENPIFKYPHLMWDLLPKASASQVHPHAQISITPDQYYGLAEDMRLQMLRYGRQNPGKNYFSDLVKSHHTLGLTVKYGSAVAIAYLTPKKENEMIVLSEEANDDFFYLLYLVKESLKTELGIYSFSMAMFFPSLGAHDPTLKIPAIARIIDRGVPNGKRSDISAMELFGASNVNADPFMVIKNIKRGVRKHSKKR